MAEKINKAELNETALDVLRAFFPEGKEITLKIIMERSGYSYEPIYRTVKELLNKKIIFEKKFGKTYVYSLDLKKIFSKIAHYFYATKRTNEFSSKEPNIFAALSELPEEELDLYAIFGSYAKGNKRKDSDIDLLCVTSNKEKVENIIHSIKRRYGLDIQAVILPKTEFAKIKKENPEFWNDLVNYGVIFKGYEVFYHYAYSKEE